MPLRKRRTPRSNGILSAVGSFIPVGVLLVILTGRQIYLTLYRNTIFEAIRRNDTESVIAMLNAGADPNQRETPPARSFSAFVDRRYYPETSSHYATPLLATLYTVEHPAPNSTNVQTNPHPNIAIIRALLERGADVHAVDDEQTSPLSFAVASGDIRVVEALVQHGVKVTDKAPWGPPLLDAAITGNAKMLRYLLEHGADVNATNSRGETALIYTVRYASKPDCVRVLLNFHSNVNARDGGRHTALWYAQHPRPRPSAHSNQRLPEIIALLKQAGAQ